MHSCGPVSTRCVCNPGVTRRRGSPADRGETISSSKRPQRRFPTTCEGSPSGASWASPTVTPEATGSSPVHPASKEAGIVPDLGRGSGLGLSGRVLLEHGCNKPYRYRPRNRRRGHLDRHRLGEPEIQAVYLGPQELGRKVAEDLRGDLRVGVPKDALHRGEASDTRQGYRFGPGLLLAKCTTREEGKRAGSFQRLPAPVACSLVSLRRTDRNGPSDDPVTGSEVLASDVSTDEGHASIVRIENDDFSSQRLKLGSQGVVAVRQVCEGVSATAIRTSRRRRPRHRSH